MGLRCVACVATQQDQLWGRGESFRLFHPSVNTQGTVGSEAPGRLLHTQSYPQRCGNMQACT